MTTHTEIQTIDVNGKEIHQYLSYPFVETDAGRSKSYWKGQQKDCTVRALSLGRSISYNDSFDICMEAGRPWDEGFMFDVWADTQEDFKGYVSFKNREVNLHEFCSESFGFCKGTWILCLNGHVLTVIEGIVYDTVPSHPSQVVKGAWKVLET